MSDQGEAYREELEELSNEELLCDYRLDDLRQDAIEARLEVMGEDLEELSLEELLGEEALASLHEDAVAVRFDAYIEELIGKEN